MSMRRLGWNLGLMGVLGVLAGCTVKQADNNNGQGGEAGGTQTGGAGGGVQNIDNGACGTVPETGVCVDDSTLRTCIIPETQAPEYVLETKCGAGRKCEQLNKENPKATPLFGCVVSGECIPGATACSADLKQVRKCEGSGDQAKWTNTPCNTAASEQCVVGKPPAAATCMVLPASSGGTGTRVVGRIKFEYHAASKTGWGPTEVQDATDVYVAIFDNGEMIGKALSGYDPDTDTYPGDGTFKAYLSRAPTDQTEVWVWPMAFNYVTGQPLMAVAKLADPDVIQNPDSAKEYWAWGKSFGEVGSQTTGEETKLGDWTITEAEGSGALHIYRWVDYGLLRMGQNFPSAEQHSLIVYWDPTKDTPSCGACFCGPQCGGGKLAYGDNPGEIDSYDSWIALGGPPSDGSTEWARAVISHEFGHYVMYNYSLSPGEGGKHYVDAASKPGLAYSEGWATFFAQSNIGSPVYVDQQNGSFFWVDISKYNYSGGALDLPKADGPIDQNVNENVEAGMLWKLWASTADDPDGRNLQDQIGRAHV